MEILPLWSRSPEAEEADAPDSLVIFTTQLYFNYNSFSVRLTCYTMIAS